MKVIVFFKLFFSQSRFSEILKEKTVDSPRCPFCNDENIGLHDVDPKEKVDFLFKRKLTYL